MRAFNEMGMVGRGALVLLVLAILAGGFWYASTMQQSQEQVFCTADALQCPDGTFVGRSGPNCEFVCPGQASTSGALQGTVVAP
jgi:hypothetical protein